MGSVYALQGAGDAAERGPVLPHKYLVREWYPNVLDDLQATPFHTLVDVTMIGHGRDIRFRQELTAGRPLHVVMSTGFYHDANLAEWVKEKSSEECEAFIVKELTEGRCRPTAGREPLCASLALQARVMGGV